MSYRETIRGEVSNRKMYAGGLSYFSSGSLSGSSLREGAWAEAAASPDNKSKQIKKRVLDIIKHLQPEEGRPYIRTDTRRPSNFLNANRPRSPWSTRRGLRSQSNREFLRE